jgi:hypothetical protein
MPVWDSHLAFAEAAAQDGIELARDEAFTWLTEVGHITLEELADDPPPRSDPEALGQAAEALDDIWHDLKGDIDVLASGRINLFLSVDLVHKPTGTLIEIDEAHHFTTFRLESLNSYPPTARVAFDMDEYRALCKEYAPQYDRFSRHQAAKGFGIGGIQRERAYRDALRDLATPAIGHPPLARFTVLDDDGAAAYARNRDRLREILGL